MKNSPRLEESVSDCDIMGKPWGCCRTFVLNDAYRLKVLELSPLSSISLQRHQFREEHWIVVFGQGEAQIGDSVISLRPGSFVFVPKGYKHRLRNMSADHLLVVAEVQLGESLEMKISISIRMDRENRKHCMSLTFTV